MAQPPTMNKGIVKQILSGDNVIIRGQPKGGPPPERQLALSNVVAPRLARRAINESPATSDEPFAWECREFLRSRLIGKEVQFCIEYKVPGSGKEYGCIFYKSASGGELKNITEELVAEGLVEVRRGGIKPSDDQAKLNELEDAAKAAKKGKWSDEGKDHVRSVTWQVESPRNFVDQKKGKPINAIIEMVRDGSTIRAFLLPSFEYVTVMLTGIKCPASKRDGDKEMFEPFSQEAKYFTDCRLLQRDLQIILEGVSSNQNFLGSVIHPSGNIAELLLKEGFAKCVDWSMGVLSSGHEKYRQAERSAKERKIRIWKDFVASAQPTLSIKDKDFNGKVVEIVNGDAVMVKAPSGEVKKIFFSSLRPPRAQPKDDGVVENGPSRDGKRGRPLYDIPYMFEAREFLRKKLIGKKVHVRIDYVKPASDGYPERQCATVKIADINIAEALISKGLATCLRHRQDDDQRSSCYDELLAAENRAQKNGKGLHSSKDAPVHRIADLSGDVSKARQFLPFLQRAGRSVAVVEFCASGSRFRLYLAKETCLLTFLLAGISCPRMKAFTPSGTQISEDEPMGQEAFKFSKEMALQREVEVQVESIDKGGNFIGWLFVDNVNLSLALVENGLSKVHFTAERSSYFKDLEMAEGKAKSTRIGVWKDHVEEVREVVVEESERKTNYKKVIVTELTDGVTFWGQSLDNASQFEQMQQQLRQDLTDSPPLPGSLNPRKGDLVAAIFDVDDLWYRARVQKIDSSDKIQVLFVDYGNREIVSSTKLAALPAQFVSYPPQAKEYTLACVKVPSDEEHVYELMKNFAKEAVNREFSLNVEYKFSGQEFVSLSNPETKQDIANVLISNGVLMVEKRREKRLQKLLTEYYAAQDKARKERRNLWRYGDFTDDDAPEFGA